MKQATLEKSRLNLPSISEAIGKGNGKGKCIACGGKGLNSKGAPCPICPKGKEWSAKLAPKNKPAPQIEPKEEEQEQAFKPLDYVTGHNRKGKSYSIPAICISASGNLIPMNRGKNDKVFLDWFDLTLNSKATKKDRQSAELAYKRLKEVHNTIICLSDSETRDDRDLRRMAVRALKKEIGVKSVSQSFRTESEAEATMALASAFTQAEYVKKATIIGKNKALHTEWIANGKRVVAEWCKANVK